MTIDFVGPATPLADSDFSAAAAALGCDEASIRAVCSVESSDGGFLPDGRPKILLEAHVFSNLTGGQFTVGHPMISAPYWNRSLYGAPGAHQYDRLAEAMALDESAALQAASWGMFQIMGQNFAACGFASVQDYVTAMVTGEGAHLAAFVAFIAADAQLSEALSDKGWSSFALHYNGPGQVDAYAARLAEAYADAQSQT